MKKKQIEAIPFGGKKVHILGDCLVIDGKTIARKQNARVCIRGTEFANYVEGEGWNQRMIGYWSSDPFRFETDLPQEEQDVVDKFFDDMEEWPEWERKRDLKGKIETMQEEVNKRKWDRAWARRRKKVMEHIKEIRPMSGKMRQWIENQMPAYAFYRTEKKESRAICCHCGGETVYDRREHPIRHNQRGTCSCCGKKIIFKSAGRQQKEVDKVRFVRFRKTKYGVAAIESAAEKISKAGEREKLRVGDAYIWFIEDDYVMYEDEKGRGSYWSDAGAYGMGNYPHGAARIYKGGLKQAIKGSTIQYSGIDVVADWRNPKEKWEEILRAYAYQPQIEKVIKAGMKRLARELDSYERFLKEGKKLQEVLGITREQMKMARDNDIGKKGISIMRQDPDNKLSLEEIYAMELATYRLAELKQYTTIRKICTYLMKGNDAGTWLDYLRMAERAGYNMKEKAVLFPGKLQKRHRDLIEEIEIKESQAKEQKWQERRPEFLKYKYKTKNYTIVVPETLQDITEEGKKLHHCVGTYIDKVIKGETDIVFIRQIGQEETPFYTMEIQGAEVIQYRGAYNNNNGNPVPESVKKFVKGFENTILRKIRKAA